MTGRLLIVHQGAIGDFILSLPALRTIKKSFPGHEFELLGHPATLCLAGDIAASISSIDRGGLSCLYGPFEDVSSGVRGYLSGFENIFIFSAQEKSLFIENLRRLNPGAVHIRTFPGGPQHVIDYQLAQLAASGFAAAEQLPRIRIADSDLARASDFLAGQAAGAAAVPLIAVHPGSGSPHKNWPFQGLLLLLQQVHEQTKAFFLIVRGPAEERAAGELQEGLAGLPHLQLLNLDLPLVAALISRCSLFIGNDSGITHLAAALGIPTVAVFGPTDPAVWAPRGKAAFIIRAVDSAGQWQWPGPDQVLGRVCRILAVDK